VLNDGVVVGGTAVSGAVTGSEVADTDDDTDVDTEEGTVAAVLLSVMAVGAGLAMWRAGSGRLAITSATIVTAAATARTTANRWRVGRRAARVGRVTGGVRVERVALAYVVAASSSCAP